MRLGSWFRTRGGFRTFEYLEQRERPETLEFDLEQGIGSRTFEVDLERGRRPKGCEGLFRATSVSDYFGLVSSKRRGIELRYI